MTGTAQPPANLIQEAEERAHPVVGVVFPSCRHQWQHEFPEPLFTMPGTLVGHGWKRSPSSGWTSPCPTKFLSFGPARGQGQLLCSSGDLFPPHYQNSQCSKKECKELTVPVLATAGERSPLQGSPPNSLLAGVFGGWARYPECVGGVLLLAPVCYWEMRGWATIPATSACWYQEAWAGGKGALSIMGIWPGPHKDPS